MEQDQELLKLKKKARRQQLIAVGVVLFVMSMIGYVFLPSAYYKFKYMFTAQNETISFTMVWNYHGKSFKLDTNVPKNRYDYYAHQPAPYIDEDFHDIVLAESITSDDETLTEVANNLKSMAEKEGYDRTQLAGLVLSFVQSKKYAWEMGEYIKHPVQTLVEGGDCEDSSILTASLLRILRYDVVLIDAPQHLAAGIYLNGEGNLEYKGKMYYYMETTSPGWGIGMIPPSI